MVYIIFADDEPNPLSTEIAQALGTLTETTLNEVPNGNRVSDMLVSIGISRSWEYTDSHHFQYYAHPAIYIYRTQDNYLISQETTSPCPTILIGIPAEVTAYEAAEFIQHYIREEINPELMPMKNHFREKKPR